MNGTWDRMSSFLAGEALSFDEANRLWKQLERDDHIAEARVVLARMRTPGALLDGVPSTRSVREHLCRQEALLTSKDVEIVASARHDLAMGILRREFDLDSPALDGDSETLGIAGGIMKRRWDQLGQTDDLIAAASFYRRGGGTDLGTDAYAQINTAFLEDLLASMDEDPLERRERAQEIRQNIVDNLVPLDDPDSSPDARWWNAATRAEAHLGLGQYDKAAAILGSVTPPKPWTLETTARQLATIAHLREAHPFDNAALRECFEKLLGGSIDGMRSALVGKVGLALSGGGFRASFYHLGVLARLAEVGALRRVEVLSCVSGGSVLGACYWLALRNRMLEATSGTFIDYVDLVRQLIEHFETAVASDLRDQAQLGRLKTLWRFAAGEKGAMDSLQVASALEAHFYRPLMPGPGPLYMHDLPYTPGDHNAAIAGPGPFNPSRHNWCRADKVPALILNATTVNTGHAWQFTPTWMGESPWSVHEGADSVPRLQWMWYDQAANWQMPLGEAVAASACVPGVFSPVRIDDQYPDISVQLVDGGVYDNQGTTALLAQSCNVLIVSDAAGQLKLERQPESGLKGLAGYALRSMDTLKERIRQANFMDLSAREESRLVRGLMILHMKAGLTPGVIRLPFSSEAYVEEHSLLTPSGVRRDFQQALAELRTDLDAFSLVESRSLMACGYQMARKAFERDLGRVDGLTDAPHEIEWPFQEYLAEITSTASNTGRRAELLAALRKGSKVEV